MGTDNIIFLENIEWFDDTGKQLVQRIPDPEDSRITLLSLTSEGHQKLDEIKGFYDYVNHQVLSQMEPEQRKTMLTNLDLLKASMEAVKEMMV